MKRLICVCLCAILLCSCATAPKQTQRTVFAMDTVMDLQIWGADREKAAQQLQTLINSLEQTWSVTRSDSLICRLNSGADVSLSAEQQALLTDVLAMHARTEGLYHPQLYVLCNAWGFYGQQYRVPTPEQITDARTYAQWDLGGALKGYCGDRAVALLENLDTDCAVLNLGGNIQTYGVKPDGSPWQIGIQDPDGGEPVGVISVNGTAAVVTSGNYQRSFQVDGKTYHHILDPRTGYPADSGLHSVTVICESGLTADCLSTALFVMGLEDGTNFWRASSDFEAVFLTADGKLYATAGANLSGCEFEVIDK